MKSLLSKILVLGCVLTALMTFGPAQGQEGRRKKGDATAGIKKKLASAELPADVLAKADKIVAENAPKIAEAQAKVDAVLTDEQRAAQKTARKAAKDAGKKGREAAAEIEAALKLTPEQKTKRDEAQRSLTAAQNEMNTALRAVLNEEQQAKVGLNKRRKNK